MVERSLSLGNSTPRSRVVPARRWPLSSPETFAEYSEPFQIEEGFLEDKSAGFQLEASRLPAPPALNAFLLVLAVGTLLHSEGAATVKPEDHQAIDSHWQRGWSYFYIGWNTLHATLSRGKAVFERLRLSSTPNPCLHDEVARSL